MSVDASNVQDALDIYWHNCASIAAQELHRNGRVPNKGLASEHVYLTLSAAEAFRMLLPLASTRADALRRIAHRVQQSQGKRSLACTGPIRKHMGPMAQTVQVAS